MAGTLIFRTGLDLFKRTSIMIRIGTSLRSFIACFTSRHLLKNSFYLSQFPTIQSIKRRQKTVGLNFLAVPTVEGLSSIVPYSLRSRWRSPGDGHTATLGEHQNGSIA